MSRIEVIEEAEVVTLRVEGTFAPEEAAELLLLLNAVEPGCDVLIDFSHVRVFSDAAFPLLVRAIGRRPCRVHGLGHHQAKMLRYFGLGSESAGQGAATIDAA